MFFVPFSNDYSIASITSVLEEKLNEAGRERVKRPSVTPAPEDVRGPCTVAFSAATAAPRTSGSDVQNALPHADLPPFIDVNNGIVSRRALLKVSAVVKVNKKSELMLMRRATASV